MSPRGRLLLLYTDGLVERRRVDMDLTTAQAASPCCATGGRSPWPTWPTR